MKSMMKRVGTVSNGLAALAFTGAMFIAPSLASADEDYPDMATLKSAVCGGAGCPGGSSQCADISGTWSILAVSVTITFYCKEGGGVEPEG